MASRSLVVIFSILMLVLLVVAVAAVCSHYFVGTDHLPGSDKRHSALRTQLTQLLQVPLPDLPYKFRSPFTLEDGVPILTIRLLSQHTLFRCVADTGSLHLNVSAEGCDACDGNNGIYEDSEALQHAPSHQLVYGTQSDRVKLVADDLQFHTDGPFSPIPVHVTVQRGSAPSGGGSGQFSNYNVLGLLPHERGVLRHVLRGDAAQLCIQFDGNERGHVGALEEGAFAAAREHALVIAPLVPSDMGFYMVPLTGLRVGGTPIAHRERYVIVDTGSNMTSFHHTTFRRMTQGLSRGEPLVIELAGSPLTISASTYRWKGGSETMIDDDTSVFNSDQFVILGAHCMQNLTFLFGPQELAILSTNVPLA